MKSGWNQDEIWIKGHGRHFWVERLDIIQFDSNLFSGQDYLNWVYVENSNDDISDLTNSKLRARRRQLQGELARALAVLGINGAQFHGLASRKKIDEVKFIYSEKATKFCEIFTLHLTTVHRVKSKVKISQ